MAVNNNSYFYDNVISNKKVENSDPVNFGIGLSGGSYVSSTKSTAGFSMGRTSQTDDLNKSSTFNPQLYYNELKSYPFLQTLVKICIAPIEEAIDQIPNQIKIRPKDAENPLTTDATIIINNFFEEVDFKSFLKSHLFDFILRGGYLAYVDYRGGKFIEVTDPYDFRLIHNGKRFSWVIPNENKNTVNNTSRGTTTALTGSPGMNNLNNLITNVSSFDTKNGKLNGFRCNRFINYFFALETVDRIERKALLNSKQNRETYNNLKIMLDGEPVLKTAEKLPDEEKERLDNILILYTTHRPKSMFEPHLKALFTLSIKEMVFNMLSLMQYLKTDYVTVNVRGTGSSVQNEKINNIVQNIKSGLNKYNLEYIRTFEDPSGIINTVYQKLINRCEVLPMVDEYTDIQMLNIPDIEQRLATLYQDIIESKRALADEIGISQESISGNSNRWEAISRNEKMVLNEMDIKRTIEEFILHTACVVFYNHSNEAFWQKKLEGSEYITKFNFDNKTHYLAESNGIIQELINFDKKTIVVDKKENHDKKDDERFVAKENKDKQEITPNTRVGIWLKPSDFDFSLNLSTILDSYASKSKEVIISENLQSTMGVLDNIKNLANYADVINGSEAVIYLNKLLEIGGNISKIIDPEKIKELLTADAMGQDDMMTDEYGNPMDPNAMGGMEGGDPNMMMQDQGYGDPNMMNQGYGY